ncbi:MAG: hypothetical protein WCD53_02420 [Microcoleus sp.]
MLRIEASTPQPTANTSIISDITEDLQVGNYTSNHSSPSAPKNLLTTNEISSTSSIELLRSNNKILDRSPENHPRQADIDAFILNKNPTQTINSIAEKPQTSTSKTDIITGDTAQPATHNNIPFDSGIFQGNQTGKISFDYLSELRTSEKDKQLIAEATPKTETKLAQKKQILLLQQILLKHNWKIPQQQKPKTRLFPKFPILRQLLSIQNWKIPQRQKLKTRKFPKFPILRQLLLIQKPKTLQRQKPKTRKFPKISSQLSQKTLNQPLQLSTQSTKSQVTKSKNSSLSNQTNQK